MRCSSARRSGNRARMRPAREMSRDSTGTPSRPGVGLDDRQERVRRQQRRLVGARVDDGGGVLGHLGSVLSPPHALRARRHRAGGRRRADPPDAVLVARRTIVVAARRGSADHTAGAAAYGGADGSLVIAGAVDGAGGSRPAVWELRDGVLAAPQVVDGVLGAATAVAADDRGEPVLLLATPDGPAVATEADGAWSTVLLPGGGDATGIGVSASSIVVTGTSIWRSTDGARSFEVTRRRRCSVPCSVFPAGSSPRRARPAVPSSHPTGACGPTSPRCTRAASCRSPAAGAGRSPSTRRVGCGWRRRPVSHWCSRPRAGRRSARRTSPAAGHHLRRTTAGGGCHGRRRRRRAAARRRGDVDGEIRHAADRPGVRLGDDRHGGRTPDMPPPSPSCRSTTAV